MTPILPYVLSTLEGQIRNKGQGDRILRKKREYSKLYRMGEFFTKSIDNLSHGLTVKKAMESLGLKDAKDLLSGMEVRLLNHQVIGVAWMIAKEESSDCGGILADDMGLGKTVQMIATMVTNQASLDEEHRTTLIVVPAALLNQASPRYNFYIPGDIEASQEIDWLAVNGYVNLSMLDDLPDIICDVSGILARAKFYRAVADEAQFIRNRATRSSISLAYVQAKYRWMLTGTPVTNTLADIYGLLRFGRLRPWNDWTKFEAHIAKVQYSDAPLAGSRAQAILKPILLRRTKNSTLEGKPILQLPNKDIQIVKLEFSRDERDLYDSFERRTKIRLNRFIRERTLVKNKAVVLVMILRLRQLCCHPNLILSQAEEYDDPTLLVGSDSDREIARATKVMGGAWVAEVKKSGQGNDKENLKAETEYETGAAKGYRPCPTCQKMTDLTPSKVFRASAFEPTDEELTKHARDTRRRKGARRMSDVKTRSPSPKASLDDSGLDDSDDDLPDVSTILDRRPAKRQKKSHAIDDDDDEVVDLTIDQVSKLTGNAKSPLSDSKNDSDLMDEKPSLNNSISHNDDEKRKSPTKERERDDKLKPSDAVIATWSRGDDGLEPSAKMIGLLDLLQEWEATGDKTIVYSQSPGAGASGKLKVCPD
ncbi:hypothetical protein C0992_010201 [Termitomyces sp. T32_za158]|nr:hypothetical protein C0992_010201 [Termitomyces sp. T32_za158]